MLPEETTTDRLFLRRRRDEDAEPRLYSFTLPRNRRSRAVMERLGFTHRGEAHWHGHDVAWYALDR